MDIDGAHPRARRAGVLDARAWLRLRAELGVRFTVLAGHPTCCSTRTGHVPYWDEQRVRRRLAPLCAGHERFPIQREFRDAGETGLLGAICRFGGTERWAREFDLRTPGQPAATA